jgi:Sec-independent protein translocase protein TatA
MDAFAELLQPLGLGHWLIIAGGILMVVGALGLLIRRSGRTGSEVEDEVTPDAS